MKQIRVGVIGLGSRGKGNLKTILTIDDVAVTAVCDIYEDRCRQGCSIVEEKGQPTPFSSTAYQDILCREDVDVIAVFSSWESHIRIAVDAMKAGKIVGLEVGGAETVEECWELVDTYEATGTPIMLLENCCYGKNEMLVRNMVRDGLFGEIVHCHGAYAHDLRGEVSTGKENRHYRLNHYLHRNCENYPTHELGPIAKILDINRGNRMTRLVSFSSKAAGLKQYINDRKDTFENKELIGKDFMQGDIVSTTIACAGGETITLTLDTTLPRSYSREFTVRGTKGMYEENTNSVFLDGEKESFDTAKHYKEVIDNARSYEEKYLPDIWKNITEEQKKKGHGGMDYFEFVAFFDAIRHHKPMPIDVYDAAAWMSITALSARSIAGGNIPVEIPDFTRGKWKDRERLDV
ncbi:MAG: Gfo/Idh/MocA family oxidoreductase [Clostridia bacterium]|nr:Gfo/Idh/MocA family oxidoreductase [Clostridia bacterium]